MPQAEPTAMCEALSTNAAHEGTSITDSVFPAACHSRGLRISALFAAAIAGLCASLMTSAVGTDLILLFGGLAFVGGLLSTWSPCGYSSLSLLRVDPPQDLAAVIRWIPTIASHAVGYAAGGLVLVFMLSIIGWLVPVQGFGSLTLAGIACIALLYGLHQLHLFKMPYPQLRLQVSHGARMGLPRWATAFLYGIHLGLNFATYVRSPILYVIVLACIFSDSLLTTLVLVLSLNLGRFLPLLINLLPVPDWSVQRWMADHHRTASVTDGGILVFVGAFLMFIAVSQYL